MQLTQHAAAIVFVLGLGACSQPMTIDVQGHRGCRGLRPENTLPAFLHAIDLGVHTLEMDVCMLADGLLAVSHEPWMNPEIARGPDGAAISEDSMHQHNLYEMTAEQLQQYDVGSKRHPRFPEQQLQAVAKPLLVDVIAAAEKAYPSVRYNIEIKSRPEWDSLYYPSYKEYADALVSVITENDLKERATIQSFDVRTLQYLHSRSLGIDLVYLVDEGSDDLSVTIDKLGFRPQIYSPHFSLVDQKLRRDTRDLGISLIPWTVNKREDIQLMLDMGVDGIITDYPNRIPAEYLRN